MAVDAHFKPRRDHGREGDSIRVQARCSEAIIVNGSMPVVKMNGVLATRWVNASNKLKRVERNDEPFYVPWVMLDAKPKGKQVEISVRGLCDLAGNCLSRSLIHKFETEPAAAAPADDSASSASRTADRDRGAVSGSSFASSSSDPPAASSSGSSDARAPLDASASSAGIGGTTVSASLPTNQNQQCTVSLRAYDATDNGEHPLHNRTVDEDDTVQLVLHCPSRVAAKEITVDEHKARIPGAGRVLRVNTLVSKKQATLPSRLVTFRIELDDGRVFKRTTDDSWLRVGGKPGAHARARFLLPAAVLRVD